MRNAIKTALFMLGFGASQALADDAPVVVELYTSQGCSSCPAADKILHKLSSRDDVIALALHVDYWDYIGWKDIFARPEHTQRQRNYARAAHQRTIYTPQMVVAGKDHVIGAKPMDVMDLIAKHKAKPAVVSISASREGEAISVALTSTGAPAPMWVQLVRYTPEEVVDIRRGENAGKRLTYNNIVTAWDRVGEWDGKAPSTLTLKAPGDAPAVVIVQEAGFGPILSAQVLR
ncbi:DUF1223 domain-containing protein [Alphaproteobacteria bacterium KMM 3653]|uniref:DUF1223 domain-containing protein n=1 Tax=Harenicola maris TaxID=2841044 RepID=A0AAP2G7D0_9RHOB|nr:DUF1223 domain-containing protein [Harenicola maris]